MRVKILELQNYDIKFCGILILIFWVQEEYLYLPPPHVSNAAIR